MARKIGTNNTLATPINTAAVRAIPTRARLAGSGRRRRRNVVTTQGVQMGFILAPQQ
jgi:hypothetical protein